MEDSAFATQEHKKHVREIMADITKKLTDRAYKHDDSKLGPEEKPYFDEATKLSSLTYMSDEYKQALNDLQPALKHHYAVNRHHPEHHENGINDMTIVDVIEMLVDWRAAGLRHDDGCIYKSIEQNQKRFGMSDQLTQIFINTAKALCW